MHISRILSFQYYGMCKQDISVYPIFDINCHLMSMSLDFTSYPVSNKLLPNCVIRNCVKTYNIFFLDTTNVLAAANAKILIFVRYMYSRENITWVKTLGGHISHNKACNSINLGAKLKPLISTLQNCPWI